MKLVAPVYSLQPMIDRIIEFKGLNRNPVIDDGEMREMKNMSCDEYPCLTQRKPRGTFTDDDSIDWSLMDVQAPVALLQKGRLEDGANVKKLAVIDHVGNDYIFKYDGASYPGLSLSSATQMVAINTRICFFPEKKWFNVQTKETGDIEASLSCGSMTITSDSYYQILSIDAEHKDTFTLTPVGAGGTLTAVLSSTPLAGKTISVEYNTFMGSGRQVWTISGFAKGEAKETTVYGGSIAYDGDKTFVLSIASSFPSTGTIASASYVTTGINGDVSEFKDGDAINIYGSLVVGENTYDYTGTPVSCRIEKIDGAKVYILDGTFLELTQEGETSATLLNARIERSCPDIDYVIEYNNRLWGVDNANNEIRASKLGDPTNWNYFQGESIDSYAATQGTDGAFTGAAAYSNHLLFFKEDYIHKVYGSKPSVFQVEIQTAFGLEKGSHKSVQIVNDTVFYKSRVGIMGYSGSTPFIVSEAFGQDTYKNVVSGQDGRKYYCSMEKPDGTFVLMVFDVSTGMWHVEDDIHVIDFCYYKGKLLMIIGTDIKYAGAESGEDNMPWHVEFGAFDEFIENKKVYSKIRMNLEMKTGSTLAVKIKEEDGAWETVQTIGTATTDTEETVVVVPRRCNRYSIRLEGTGRVQIRTLTRQYRVGTDRKDIK